jgi:hypothetical protein
MAEWWFHWLSRQVSCQSSLGRWFAKKKNSRKTCGDEGKMILMFLAIGGCFCGGFLVFRFFFFLMNDDHKEHMSVS